MHAFERYFRRKGHYPTLRVRIGPREKHMFIEVVVAPTYISISRPPYGALYIPRKQLFTILRWLIPLAKRMDKSRDFDPEVAMHEAYEREADHLADQRALKSRPRPMRAP